MKDTVHIYDRLSKRHNWTLCGSGYWDVDYTRLVANNCADYANWEKEINIKASEKMNIEDVKRINKEKGYHFFDEGAMKFFNSRLETTGKLIGDKYFITSEKFTMHPRDNVSYDDDRAYNVREFNPEKGNIKTIGEHCEWISKKQAEALAVCMDKKDDIDICRDEVAHIGTDYEDFIVACKKHSDYLTNTDVDCILETKSTAGQPLTTQIRGEESINAYRREDPDILVAKKEGSKIHMDVNKEFSDYFKSTPVMKIIKENDGQFTVDFEAGFQRGRYRNQTEEDLCTRLDVVDGRVATHDPWLKWIGLDCKNDLIDCFLNGW